MSPRIQVPKLLALALAILPVQSAFANAAPRITGAAPSTVSPGATYQFQPTVKDPEGKRVTCTFNGRPSWMRFDAATCRVSGTAPTTVRVGTVYSNLRIVASDGSRTASLPAFSVRVVAAPIGLTGTPPSTVRAGSRYAFTPTLSNPAKKTVSFSIVGKPAWLSFSTVTGALSGTPDARRVGTYSGIRITVSDGATSRSIGPFAITVTAAGGAANRNPAISGSAPTSVRAGVAYSFRPTASDPDGDTLTFSVSNKPAWASFDTRTGALTGTPTSSHTGSYGSIVVTASDGRGGQASLAPFSILVGAGGSGSAVLSWTPPTRLTDGAALVDLAGYRIRWGTSANSLTQSAELRNPGATSYTVTGLDTGTWYFSVSALTSGGVEGSPTAVRSKAIQ